MRAARIIVGPDSRPILPRHVHLRFDAQRGRTIVLAPEKILWPDEISAEILTRCDGRRTVNEISASLAEDYDAVESEIAADIVEFLQDWSDRLLIDVRAGKKTG